MKKLMPKGSAEDTSMLNDMFAQMTGEGNADAEIIVPKLFELNRSIKKYIQIYELLIGFKEFRGNFPEYEVNFLEIQTFIDKLKVLITDGITIEKLKKLSVNEVNQIYKKLKNAKEVQTIIIISGNLKKYKRYLSDRSNLGDEFIKREPGLSFTPLKFTKLDLKILWASEKLTSMAKKYILNILSHTFIIGHNMYQLITSPDIDIRKFSEVLIKNIDKMKKQIPRCDKAFDVIANSVNLLENNFEGYYKTSVEAENPSIIVESFIIDVSMSQKANASITAQFRKIIMFMKRQASNNKDPRVAKLFKILNSQFSMMQSETGADDDADGSDETTNEDADENKDNDAPPPQATVADSEEVSNSLPPQATNTKNVSEN